MRLIVFFKLHRSKIGILIVSFPTAAGQTILMDSYCHQSNQTRGEDSLISATIGLHLLKTLPKWMTYVQSFMLS